MDAKTDNQGPAEPGTPLEPDELEPSPPEFQEATQSKRQEQAKEPPGHPTSALSSTPSHKRGPVAPAGKHPTSELHIKPKGRR
jgi:hypothetical protein